MELQKRGWVEKIITTIPTTKVIFERFPHEQTLLRLAADGNIYEQKLLSNMVLTYPTYYLYTTHISLCTNGCQNAVKNLIEIQRARDFCIKDGINQCYEERNFSTENGISVLQHPKTFCVHNDLDMQVFINEYTLTACRSWIYFLAQQEQIEDFFTIEQGKETINVANFERALLKVRNVLEMEKDHQDIDPWFKEIIIKDDVLRGIIKDFNLMQDNRYKIYIPDSLKIAFYIQEIRHLAKISLEHWPTSIHDGYKNIWLIKPKAGYGGRDITCHKNLDDIMRKLKRSSTLVVIQKYIERPLLIHGSKFDIRYFFMVTTETDQLSIWANDFCYLRFSTVLFDLNNLNQRVHLTNVSLQKNFVLENDKLPASKQMSHTEFDEYLKSVGYENVWEDKILPQIKQNIVGLILSGVDGISFESGRFCLFGADFLITDDFHVLFLECNKRPQMADATTVTRPIFKDVLQDFLKGIFCCNTNAIIV